MISLTIYQVTADVFGQQQSNLIEISPRGGQLADIHKDSWVEQALHVLNRLKGWMWNTYVAVYFKLAICDAMLVNSQAMSLMFIF